MSKGAYQIPTMMRGLWPNGQVPYTFDSGAAFSTMYCIVFIEKTSWSKTVYKLL